MIGKETFLQIFVQFNNMIFPAQIIFYLGALLVIFRLVKKPGEKTNQFVNIFLGTIWVFMGLFYFIMNYAKETPAGYLFGAFFIAGGVIFWFDVRKKKLNYDIKTNKGLFIGISLISLILYEIMGYLMGHIYPAAPIFSAPCPTTMFTLGLLLLTIKNIRVYHFLVPLCWALFAGLNAPKMFGIYQDYLLFLVGVTFLFTIIAAKVRLMSNSKRIIY